MAADWESAFEDYVYATACGMRLAKITRPVAVKMRTADTPGMNRGYSAGGLLAPVTFAIEGMILGSSSTNLRDRVDNFIAAHAPGTGKRFFPHSDRYRNAEVRGIGEILDDAPIRYYTKFSVEFYSADPLLYATTATSTTGLAGGGTVTNAGNAFTSPTLTVAVSSIGTDGTVTIGNTTTGQSLVLTPDATGTFTIDCAAETVSRSSVYRPATHSGDWLRLDPGANTITVGLAGSATISALSFSHRGAWY